MLTLKKSRVKLKEKFKNDPAYFILIAANIFGVILVFVLALFK